MAKRLTHAKHIPLLIVAILAVFLFFWHLGAAHLTNWDEAWYADISRTIAERGAIFSPAWNGRPFLEKPPLFYWLTALSYRTFGDSEFSARFISAFSAFVTTLLVFVFVQKRWGSSAAFVSSLVLLSTPAYLWRARTGNLDSLLTLLLFLEVYLLSTIAKSKHGPWIAGIAIGLAFLTKGSVAFIFPCVAAILYFLNRQWKFLMKVLLALILGATISSIWLGTAYVVNGSLFLVQFLGQQTEKIGSPLSFVNNLSFEILDYLKSGIKLWAIVFVPALLVSLLSWRKHSESIITWYIVVFTVLLSFFRVKSSWFLMPVYPLIAVIISLFIMDYTEKMKIHRFLVIGTVAAVAMFQLLRFHTEYIVPDIARDEALVALASRQYTKFDDVIYLTQYYYPTAVYYSRRTTYAVYSENPSPSWWILSKTSWSGILQKDRVFINTNQEDLKLLQDQFPKVHFEILFQSGDKLLVKKG